MEFEYLEIILPAEQEIQDDGTWVIPEHTLRHQGRWRVHQKDDDDWPSNFHAHNVEDPREKLDLYTGIIYNTSTKEPIRKLSEKSMRFMYNELAHCKNEQLAAKCTGDKKTFQYLK